MSELRKTIDGVTYDTAESELIGEFEYGSRARLDGYYEALFRAPSGEPFLFGSGGPNSPWAESFMGESFHGRDIIPVSEDFARKWATRTLSGAEYREAFGESPVDVPSPWLANPPLARQSLDAKAAYEERRKAGGLKERAAGLMRSLCSGRGPWSRCDAR